MEKRIDPFYYVPSLVKLEKRVWEQGAVPLRTFIRKMASGATPAIAEEAKFYAPKDNGGIPFVRVQNLGETAELYTDDLKYINNFTHSVYLKRSQIKPGDLLTKITGVGRMAVSAVAPDGFVGNINQHIVVSKTADAETSAVLAAYLNSDIGEKLASRRATGGTRPALDYPALRSIPVVFNPEIIALLKNGADQKRQKEAQAQTILDGIDTYLLDALGVVLPPEPANTIQNRTFRTSWQQVTGGRFDPFVHTDNFKDLEKSLVNGKHKLLKIRELTSEVLSGARPKGGVKQIEEGVLSLGGEHVNDLCEIDVSNPKYIPFDFHKQNKQTETKLRDVILVKDGATTGKIGLITSTEHVSQNINEHVFLLRFKTLNPYFFTFVFATNFYQKLMAKAISGATVTGLTRPALGSLNFPVPPKEIQSELVNHVELMRKEAFQFRQEAQQDFAKAKQAIEQLILNGQ